MIIKVTVSTNRKWNVLSKLITPKVMLSVRYITSELEEIEREDNFRLKRFKELKTKKNKDVINTNYRCYCDKKPGKGDDLVCLVCKAEEEKRKAAKNEPYSVKSKSYVSEVIGDKHSNLTTANQKRLNDLTTHLEIVISLTNQCKTEGLVSPSADTFVYACKEIRCKVEEIDKPQNSCNTNAAQASQDMCCNVCENVKGEQAPEIACSKNNVPLTQGVCCDICEDGKEELKVESDVCKVCDETNIVQGEDIPCKTCKDDLQNSNKENVDNLFGCFETKYKEIVKIVKVQNEDGTVSEEKQVITIKTERKHPHKPNELGRQPCCKIDSFDSGFVEKEDKNNKVCCKEIKAAKSQDIPNNTQEQQTKVRLCVSDTKNYVRDTNKTLKLSCSVCDTGTEPKTPSVSSVIYCPKKSSSINENSKIEERKKSRQHVCCKESFPSKSESNSSVISDKSAKNICCNTECPSKTESIKSKESEKSCKNICCNTECPSKTESNKSKVSENSSKNICCNSKCPSQTRSIKSNISEKSSKNICCIQKCPSQIGSSKSKISEKSSKNICCNQKCPSQTSNSKSKISQKSSKNVCCNKKCVSHTTNNKSKVSEKSKKKSNKKTNVCCNMCSSETGSNKSKVSEKPSKTSIKPLKNKTSKKDKSCVCAAPTKSTCCDTIWKDACCSTTDLAENSEETEEECICIQETDVIEPKHKDSPLCCDQKDDKVKQKKSSLTFSFQFCNKSKDELKETENCSQCKGTNEIDSKFEECPYCISKAEVNSKSGECPKCVTINKTKSSFQICSHCDANKENENDKEQPSSENCPHFGMKTENNEIKLKSGKCPHCAEMRSSKPSAGKCPQCVAENEAKTKCRKCPHCGLKSDNINEVKLNTGKCPHCTTKIEVSPSFEKCPHCVSIKENKNEELNTSVGKCPHCGTQIDVKSTSAKCLQRTTKIELKHSCEKCPHCTTSQVKTDSGKCPHCAAKSDNDRNDGSGKCPHCAANTKVKPRSGNCPHCSAKSEIKSAAGKCPQCDRINETNDKESKPETCCKIRIISKQSDGTDGNNGTVQEFVFLGNILDAIKHILQSNNSEENVKQKSKDMGESDTLRKSCSCSTLMQSPPPKILSCPYCGKKDEESVARVRQKSQSLGNICCKQQNNEASKPHRSSLRAGGGSCPSCREEREPYCAVCESMVSATKNNSVNKETKDQCSCQQNKEPKPIIEESCQLCQSQSQGYNKQNNKEIKCPRTILKSRQSCPVCEDKDQRFSNERQTKSEDSCCSAPKVKLCCDSDEEEVTKKDASTSTRRSDKYDVRPLKLMKSQKKLQCTCQSDTIVLQSSAEQDPRKCQSCFAYHNDYCM